MFIEVWGGVMLDVFGLVDFMFFDVGLMDKSGRSVLFFIIEWSEIFRVI